MTASGRSSIWSRNFICVLLANSLLQLSHTAVNTLVSTYTIYLGAGPRLMGFLTGMFFGVALAMRPVAGPLSTRIDHRKLLICVFGLGVIVNSGYALFHSVPMFLAFRVLHGVQYAFVGSLCITIAADSLPQEKMSSGLGVFGAGNAVATSIAPQAGIWMHDWGEAVGGPDMGFTFVFLFAALVLAAALIPCFLLLPDEKAKVQMDSVGHWYETILSKSTLIPGAVMMLLIMSYALFSAFMLPLSEEIDVQNIGVFFTALSLTMLAARPLCGKLSDRFGVKWIYIPGSILFAAAFLAISRADTLSMILVGAVLAAVGYGAANPAIQSLSMQMEPKARRAVASNTLYVGMDLGLFFGPLIGGFIKEYASYRAVLFFGCIPAVLSLLVFLLGWRRCARRLDTIRNIE